MRGEAMMPSFKTASPQGVISRCTAALGRKELKEHQNLRRAHLLRARAAAYLAKGDAASALADLDAAEKELASYRGEFFFERSMGVSFDLLRAIAYSEMGRGEEALALAEMAESVRPYALQVQMTSTLLRDVHAKEGAPKAEVWRRLGQISPGAREAARIRVAMEGEPAKVVHAMSEQAGEERPTYQSQPNLMALIGGGDIMPALQSWLSSYQRGADIAYARAAAGHVEEARLRLTELNQAVAATTRKKTEGEGEARGLDAFAAPLLKKYDERHLSGRKALVEARIALSEGRPQDVLSLLEGHRLKENVQTLELYDAYDHARDEFSGSLSDLPTLEPSPAPSLPNLSALPETLLIRPEDPRKLIDYKKSRPDVLGGLIGGVLSMGFGLLGGFERTKGFQSETLENGLIKVEYNGQTTSAPMVQEMTLLRAAEIAREQGHSFFLVHSRKDYGVYWGTSWERKLTGYKTVFEIELLDEDKTSDEALDAVAVIDTLGPIYYSDEA